MNDLIKPWHEAREINAKIELSVYGPLGNEQASAASSWETAKLLANAFERVKQLEALVRELRVGYLRMANAVANQVPDRTKLFADLHPDSDD